MCNENTGNSNAAKTSGEAGTPNVCALALIVRTFHVKSFFAVIDFFSVGFQLVWILVDALAYYISGAYCLFFVLVLITRKNTAALAQSDKKLAWYVLCNVLTQRGTTWNSRHSYSQMAQTWHLAT